MSTSTWSMPSLNDIFSGTANNPGNPVGDKNYWNTMGGRIGSALWPGLASQLQYSNSLVPQQQSATSSLLTALNPSNLQSLLNNYNQASNQAAAQQSQLAGLMGRANGLSSGAVQGAQMNVANQAARNQNSNMQSVLSPEGIQRAYSQYLGALSNAMTPSSLKTMQSLMSGTPATVSSGDGWSSLLGGVAGLAGNFFSPTASAGGSGIDYGTMFPADPTAGTRIPW